MSITTKILLAAIALLSITCGILWGMVKARGRTIAHMERSIQHGMDIARTNEQTSTALRLMVHELRQRQEADSTELARLRRVLNTPVKVPDAPRTTGALHRSIMDGVRAR